MSPVVGDVAQQLSRTNGLAVMSCVHVVCVHGSCYRFKAMTIKDGCKFMLIQLRK